VPEAAADPIPARHHEEAAQWEPLGTAATDYEAGPVRKYSPLGHRSAVVVVAEPAAIGLAEAEPAAIALAAAEAAGTALAAADSLVTHPVSVASAVQGPVFVASAAEAPVSAEFADQAQVSGGSAECSGILRQRQAADGQRTQEAGPYCSQPLAPERPGVYAWSLAVLLGLLCSGRSNSLGPEHSRLAHRDALRRSPRRG
jgi:hypothetical protein